MHLGRHGLTIFSNTIKDCVCAKTGNQSKSRFSASRGNYSAAAARPVIARRSPQTRGTTVRRSTGVNSSLLRGGNRFAPLSDIHE